jgi:hypothetical protein
MPNLVKITTRFSDEELLALASSATELGLVDRNGKPKISTFIRVAINSNRLYKKNITSIIKTLGEKDE